MRQELPKNRRSEQQAKMGVCQDKPQYMPDGTPVTPLPKKKIMALVICSMTWGFQMNIIFVSGAESSSLSSHMSHSTTCNEAVRAYMQ